jgi:nitrate/nitrite transporter NarK
MPSANRAECEAIRSQAGGAGSIYDDDHRPAVPWTRLLISSNLLAVYLASAAVSFCWYFNVTFLPRYLKERYGVDYARSELLSGLPLIAGGLACLAGGGLSDALVRRTGSKRWGRSLPGLAGFLLAGATALVIPHLTGEVQAILAICLICVFQDLAVPCLWSLPADIGGRYAGTAGGFMNSVGALAGALSPPLVASIKTSQGWSAVFYVFAAVYAAGALLWLRIDAGRPLIEDDAVNPGPR